MTVFCHPSNLSSIWELYRDKVKIVVDNSISVNTFIFKHES